MIEPTFALFFQLTTKVGKKEVYAKRWHNLPEWKRIEIYNKALNDKEKKAPDYYLNIGR